MVTVMLLPAGTLAQLQFTAAGKTVQPAKPPETVTIIGPTKGPPESTFARDTPEAARGPLFRTLTVKRTEAPRLAEFTFNERFASLGTVVVVVGGGSSTTTFRLSMSSRPASFVTVSVTV
jgi:hypothetical protein